jgi:hypothetical protein
LGGATPQIDSTGWASYADNIHTLAAPFVIAPATTTNLENNAGSVINTYLPTGVISFYDATTNKITPNQVGDAYTIGLRFSAKTTTQSDSFSISLDVGGTQNIIIAESITFVKAANTEQKFNVTFPVFSLGTFITNGGLIKIDSGSGTLSIYNVTYFIQRTYKSF